MTIPKNLLWVDCIAGSLNGVAVLLLRGWLANVYALPRGLLLVIGIVNVAYASFSFSLAMRRPPRPMRLINGLVIANLVWAVICLGMAVFFSGTATLFGLGHLILESLFVGALAIWEWSRRASLRTVA